MMRACLICEISEKVRESTNRPPITIYLIFMDGMDGKWKEIGLVFVSGAD